MRWMDLRYPGKCKVCRTDLPVGAHAYYDSANKTVTCPKQDCLDLDNLQIGNDTRTGPPAPIPARTSSGYRPRKTNGHVHSPQGAVAAPVAPKVLPNGVILPPQAGAAVTLHSTAAPLPPLELDPSEVIDAGGIPPTIALRCPCCNKVFMHECADAPD